MKAFTKSERKILEKQIIEVVNVLLEKYEPKPAKKIQRIVHESARSISKKLYKAIKDKRNVPEMASKQNTIAKTTSKVKLK